MFGFGELQTIIFFTPATLAVVTGQIYIASSDRLLAEALRANLLPS